MNREEYILDLTRLLIELDDPELTSKNLVACLFAQAVKEGLGPGQFLVKLAEELPSYDEWFEEYLPNIMEYPEDYETIGEE